MHSCLSNKRRPSTALGQRSDALLSVAVCLLKTSAITRQACEKYSSDKYSSEKYSGEKYSRPIKMDMTHTTEPNITKHILTYPTPIRGHAHLSLSLSLSNISLSLSLTSPKPILGDTHLEWLVDDDLKGGIDRHIEVEQIDTLSGLQTLPERRLSAARAPLECRSGGA